MATLNGVDLEQPGKWWSFVNDWPFVHGWCAPAHRAELIEAVTGATTGAPNPTAGPMLPSGTSLDVVNTLTAGYLMTQDYTFSGTPSPAHAELTGDHRFRLLDGSTLRAAMYASMHWGAMADGDDRFTFSFCGAPYPELEIPPAVEDFATEQSTANGHAVPLTVTDGDCLYVSVLYYGTNSTLTATWHPDYIDSGTRGAGESLTLIDSDTNTIDAGPSDATIALFRIIAPNASGEATSSVWVGSSSTEICHSAAWSVVGVDQSTPETDTATNTGSGSSSSVTVSGGDLILDMAGWVAAGSSPPAPTPTAGQTALTEVTDRGGGSGDMSSGAGHGSAVTPTWGFGASHAWAAVAVGVRSA